MLPWSFSEEAAAEKHMPQVQHNMWVANATAAVLSIITGGGKWLEIKLSADPLYQHLLLKLSQCQLCYKSGVAPKSAEDGHAKLQTRAAIRVDRRISVDRSHRAVACRGRLMPPPTDLTKPRLLLSPDHFGQILQITPVPGI